MSRLSLCGTTLGALRSASSAASDRASIGRYDASCSDRRFPHRDRALTRLFRWERQLAISPIAHASAEDTDGTSPPPCL